MRLPGPDVLLLSPRGDDQAFVAEVLDIADDGPGAAIEQPIGEILVTEKPALFTSLGTHPEDPCPTQAGHPLPGTNLQIVVPGVEGEHHRDLLALFERLSWGLFGSDHQQLDLADIELLLAVVIEGIEFLDGLQDRLGDKGSTVGSFLDSTTKHAVERLGLQPALT